MSSVTGQQSSACCSLPPVQADYTPTGTYTTFSDLKSYVVGDENAKSAVLIVYDIFGYSPQILQGADLLASQGYRVVMPDFMKGETATPEMFSGSEEGNKKKEAFFSAFPGAIPTQSAPVAKAVKALKEKYSKVGGVGYCWGYKVIVTSEGIADFDAVAGAHPSFADPSDAEKFTQPVLLLPSQGEDMEVMNKIYEALEKKSQGKNKIRQFPEDPHGWLAARGDLKSEKGKKSFTEGYTEISNFFKANL